MIKETDLSKYDFWILGDRSSSMREPIDENNSNSPRKWDHMREQFRGLVAEASNYDDDGISLMFFAGERLIFNNIGGGADKEAALREFDKLFDEHGPNGTTNTAGALEYIFSDYNTRKRKTKEVKPLLITVMTDGRPDDEPAVARAIANFSKTLDNEDECGITFIQIGNNKGAEEFLKMLDDKLTSKYGAKFDIVDTMKLSDMEKFTFSEIFCAAVND